MKNCSKGFSFSETIAAFSIWTLIVSLLIPQMIMITVERVQAKQSLDAQKILYDKTQKITYGASQLKNEEFIENNTHYQLIFEVDGPYKKGCLYWETLNEQKKSTCLLLSK